MTLVAQRWTPTLALLTLLAACGLPGVSQAHHRGAGGFVSPGTVAETLFVSGHRYRVSKRYKRYAHRADAYRQPRYHHRYERPRYRSSYRGRYGGYRHGARGYRHGRYGRTRSFSRRGY